MPNAFRHATLQINHIVLSVCNDCWHIDLAEAICIWHEIYMDCTLPHIKNRVMSIPYFYQANVLTILLNHLCLTFNLLLIVMIYARTLVLVKPGFHTLKFIGNLLSGITEGENEFRNKRVLSIVDHRQ